MAGSSPDSGIEGEKGGFQHLSQGDVGRVVRGEIWPKGPDPGEKGREGNASEGRLPKKLHHGTAPGRRNHRLEGQTPRDLGYFDIEVGRNVNVLVPESPSHSVTPVAPHQPFEDRRSVCDDHRASRSARTRSAAGGAPSIGSSRRTRALISSTVGRATAF